MADSDPHPAKTGSPSAGDEASSSAMSSRQIWLIAYVVSIAVIGVVLLTLILAFHYTTAADASSVLGVVIPIFSAVIGVVVGGGAGVAAGSAGRKSLQDNLTATKGKVDSAKTQMVELEAMVKKLLEQMQQHLSSPPGVGALTVDLTEDSPHVVEFTQVDNITSKLGHIKGLLE